jgi:hypothetical protein
MKSFACDFLGLLSCRGQPLKANRQTFGPLPSPGTIRTSVDEVPIPLKFEGSCLILALFAWKLLRSSGSAQNGFDGGHRTRDLKKVVVIVGPANLETISAYEINPQILNIAKSFFSYLSDTPAQTEIVLGDARLATATFDNVSVTYSLGQSGTLSFKPVVHNGQCLS